jgi:adenylate cyclase
MRLTYLYQDWENVFESDQDEVVIGRPRLGVEPGPDLDLTPDLTVSRPHARVWIDSGHYWIQDLGSTHGTQINGNEIKGQPKQQLNPGDSIRIGETLLKVEVPQPTGVGVAPHTNGAVATLVTREIAAPPEFAIPGAVRDNGLTGVITGKLEATVQDGLRLPTLEPEGAQDAASRLALLHDLFIQFGATNRLDSLLQSIVERLVDVIPHAERGALLLRGRDQESLLLKAFRSAQGPVVSETLARRAMTEGAGFIWTQNDEEGRSGSIAHYRIESGMYAPLIWHHQVLGVICVDNPYKSATFTEDDLRLLMIVGHYIAMAIANQQLQDDLRRESSLKANLMRHFSPQVAELLQHGNLQLSGERSEVTILCTDIRGFTNLTKDMEPIKVVELLNDYFSRLTPIINNFNGTVDKYIGDAILAVFGSPNDDPEQHENALRAALGMQAEMVKSNRARAAKGKAICEMGIGIHCGEVLHGYISVPDQLSLTVIGDAVNLASRYCDGARGGEILISPQVYQWVWKTAYVEPTSINTKHEGDLSAFRLIDLKDQL